MKKWFYILVSLLFVSGLITACSEDEPDNNSGNTDIEEVVPVRTTRFSSPISPNLFPMELMQ